jgi:hypothetical protein
MKTTRVDLDEYNLAANGNNVSYDAPVLLVTPNGNLEQGIYKGPASNGKVNVETLKGPVEAERKNVQIFAAHFEF